jgi:hypothetical protein
MSSVAAPPHVTLSGDIEGEYVVEDRRPDGRLVLVPDTISWDDVLARHGERHATHAEWQAFLAEYGPHMQPPDGEG